MRSQTDPSLPVDLAVSSSRGTFWVTLEKAWEALRANWDISFMWFIYAEIARLTLLLVMTVPLAIVEPLPRIGSGIGGFLTSAAYAYLSVGSSTAISVVAWVLASYPARVRVAGLAPLARLLVWARIVSMTALLTAGTALAWPDVASISVFAWLGVVTPAIVVTAIVFGPRSGLPFGRLLVIALLLVTVAACALVALVALLNSGRIDLATLWAKALANFVEVGAAVLSGGFWPFSRSSSTLGPALLGGVGFDAGLDRGAVALLVSLGSYIGLVAGSAFVSAGVRMPIGRTGSLFAVSLFPLLIPILIFAASWSGTGSAPWIALLVSSAAAGITGGAISRGTSRRARVATARGNEN